MFEKIKDFFSLKEVIFSWDASLPINVARRYNNYMSVKAREYSNGSFEVSVYDNGKEIETKRFTNRVDALTHFNAVQQQLFSRIIFNARI